MSEPRSIALFAVMAFAWGANYLFVVYGLQYTTPLWLATLRAGVAVVPVAAWLAVTAPRSVLDGRGRRDALLLGLPNTALFLGLWFAAAPLVPAGETAVIIYTFPLWVALLSPWVLGRALSSRHWAAVIVGFLGIVLISQPWAQGSSSVPAVALLALLAAAISWAIGTVLFQRRFRGNAEMQEANVYQLAGGSVALLVTSLLAEPGTLPPATVSLWLAVAWLALLGTAFAYIAWYYLLAHVPAATLAAYTFLVPIIALLLGIALLGERLSSMEIAGVALVVVSIYGIGTARSPPEGSPKGSGSLAAVASPLAPIGSGALRGPENAPGAPDATPP